MGKIKASYHAGKGYVLHNMHFRTKRDKGNINYDLTPQNVVWTRYKGMNNVVEAEKRFYNETFTEELEMQNAKYRKKAITIGLETLTVGDRQNSTALSRISYKLAPWTAILMPMTFGAAM